jgi:hypothetical protein
MCNIIGHLLYEFQPSVNPIVIPQEATVNGQENAGKTSDQMPPEYFTLIKTQESLKTQLFAAYSK